MTYSVYGLIDPQTDKVFYVGFAADPKRRKYNHLRDQSSAAFQKCQDILGSGQSVGLRILGEYPTKFEAKWEERELILTTPDLVNSKSPKSMLSLLLHPRR